MAVTTEMPSAVKKAATQHKTLVGTFYALCEEQRRKAREAKEGDGREAQPDEAKNGEQKGKEVVELTPYDHFIDRLGELAKSGRKVGEQVESFYELRQEDGTRAIWYVYPSWLAEGGGSKFTELSACDMPPDISKKMAELAEVDGFNAVSDESPCGRQIIAGAERGDKVISLGELVSVIV